MTLKHWLPLLCALALAACGTLPAATDPASPVPTESPGVPPSATPPAADPSVTPSALPPGDSASPTPPALSPATAGPVTTSAYEVQPGDKGLQRGNLFIEDFGVKVQPGNPAQVLLSLSGNRPTPCHRLRVEIGPPDAGGTLSVQAYTLLDPDRVCQQVLRPFAVEIPLDPLPPGDYTLIINDELKAAFTV